MVYVYHISRPGMNISEGYIGISSNPKRRRGNHKSRGENPHLSSAMAKYDDLQYKILCGYENEEDALSLEKTFRPSKNIGWNIAEGGGKPPVRYGTDNKGVPPSRKGAVHSEESKKRISESKRGIPSRRKGIKMPQHSGDNHCSKQEKNMRTCTYCDKIMFVAHHTQWHGEKCKLREGVKF